MSQPLLAIDGPAVLYRAFFALPDSITDDDGHPVNALLGSVNQTLWCIEKYDPRAVVWCFGAEAGEYRVEAFPAYHADRPPMPDPLEWQWERAPELYEALGWSLLSNDELEADDLLHSLAAVETEAGGKTLILTGDRDMFQCASDNVTVLMQRTGGDGPQEVDADGVREWYGDRPRAGARLHRPARRPVRRTAGRQGDRPEDGRRPAAPQGRPRARDPRRRSARSRRCAAR